MAIALQGSDYISDEWLPLVCFFFFWCVLRRAECQPFRPAIHSLHMLYQRLVVAASCLFIRTLPSAGTGTSLVPNPAAEVEIRLTRAVIETQVG